MCVLDLDNALASLLPKKGTKTSSVTTQRFENIATSAWKIVSWALLIGHSVAGQAFAFVRNDDVSTFYLLTQGSSLPVQACIVLMVQTIYTVYGRNA